MTLSEYANCGSALFGLMAAYYWFLSTQVQFPHKLHGVVIDPAVFINVDELSKAIKESARMNKIAAGFSAASMFFMAIGIWSAQNN